MVIAFPEDTAGLSPNIIGKRKKATRRMGWRKTTVHTTRTETPSLGVCDVLLKYTYLNQSLGSVMYY